MYSLWSSLPACGCPLICEDISTIAPEMVDSHMVDDQRFAATRPDVLTYATAEPLAADLTVAGPFRARVSDLGMRMANGQCRWPVNL
jgi:hypothetical protein